MLGPYPIIFHYPVSWDVDVQYSSHFFVCLSGKRGLNILYREQCKIKNIVEIIVLVLNAYHLYASITVRNIIHVLATFARLGAFRFDTWAERNMHVLHDKIVLR